MSDFQTIKNPDDIYSKILIKILEEMTAACYPNSVSDILTETRYGDMIELENMISENQYSSFMNQTVALIDNYLQKDAHESCLAENIFDMSVEVVQLIDSLFQINQLV